MVINFTVVVDAKEQMRLPLVLKKKELGGLITNKTEYFFYFRKYYDFQNIKQLA